MNNMISDYMVERFFGLDRDFKVEAIAMAIKQITGERPIINRENNYTEIKFTPDQVAQAHKKLKAAHAGDPGEIRISYGQIFAPFYIKKYAPYMLGIAGVGFLLGKIL